MSRFLDRAIMFIVIIGLFLAFITYHDDIEYSIPQAQTIFWLLAAVTGFMALLRMVVRWSFVQKGKRREVFRVISPIGKTYLKKIKTLLIIRTVVLFACGTIVFMNVPIAFVFAFALWAVASDDLFFLVQAVYRKKTLRGTGQRGSDKMHPSAQIGKF
jgi:hypothetical protein